MADSNSVAIKAWHLTSDEDTINMTQTSGAVLTHFNSKGWSDAVSEIAEWANSLSSHGCLMWSGHSGGTEVTSWLTGAVATILVSKWLIEKKRKNCPQAETMQKIETLKEGIDAVSVIMSSTTGKKLRGKNKKTYVITTYRSVYTASYGVVPGVGTEGYYVYSSTSSLVKWPITELCMTGKEEFNDSGYLSLLIEQKIKNRLVSNRFSKRCDVSAAYINMPVIDWLNEKSCYYATKDAVRRVYNNWLTHPDYSNRLAIMASRRALNWAPAPRDDNYVSVMFTKVDADRTIWYEVAEMRKGAFAINTLVTEHFNKYESAIIITGDVGYTIVGGNKKAQNSNPIGIKNTEKT